MKRVVLGLLLLAVPAMAERVQKLVVLKYAEPQAMARLLTVFGASITPNAEMRALAIVSDTENWKAVEEAIQRLDVPSAAPRNVEVTVWFVLGSVKEGQPGGAVPADLQPVVAQLKGGFPYKEYRLVDSLVLHARVGSVADASGQVSLAGGPPAVSQVKLRPMSVGPDGSVHIDNLRAGMRLPSGGDGKGGIQYLEVGISTDIDVKDGQKAVVGKYSMEGPEKAMFLVLTAKVLQ